MRRSLLVLVTTGPPLLVLTLGAVDVLGLGAGRQPLTDAPTAAARTVGVEIAGRIAPRSSATPNAVPSPAP